MLVGEVEADASADRAAHHHGLFEFERIGDLGDHADVVARRELVLLIVPAVGRRRFAVPGHIEGDDAEVVGDARVVQYAAVLPGVGAGGVQAKEWNAGAGLLDVEAVSAVEQLQVEVAADDRLVTRAHRVASLRGEAITSLM